MGLSIDKTFISRHLLTFISERLADLELQTFFTVQLSNSLYAERESESVPWQRAVFGADTMTSLVSGYHQGLSNEYSQD